MNEPMTSNECVYSFMNEPMTSHECVYSFIQQTVTLEEVLTFTTTLMGDLRKRCFYLDCILVRHHDLESNIGLHMISITYCNYNCRLCIYADVIYYCFFICINFSDTQSSLIECKCSD